MPELKYKRILLKVSGEALAGDAHRGLDFTIVNELCEVSRSVWSSAQETSGAASRTARIRCSVPTPTPWVCWAR